MRQLNKRNSFLLMLIVAAVLAVSSGAFAQIGARDGVVTNCTNTDELETLIATGGTITFNCGATTTIAGGEVNIAAPTGGAVVIDGAIAGGGRITLQAQGTGANSRIFDIDDASTVTLRNLVLTGGNVGGAPGGAIRVAAGAQLNLENVVVIGNAASSNSGAISITPGGSVAESTTVNVFRSAFINNTTPGNGGVFSVGNNTILNVANSTFAGNTTTGTGNGGVLRLGGGGNIVNFTNNTFVNNSTAGTGTGEVISRAAATPAANVQLRNNIIVGAAAGETFCDITVTGTAAPSLSTGNLFFNGTCTGVTPASTADPQLINNLNTAIPHFGLPAGSPALNLAVDTTYLTTGTNPLFSGNITTDQTGVTVRPQSGGIDAGSFELPAVAAGTSTPQSTSTPDPTAASTSTPDSTPDGTSTTAATPDGTSTTAATPDGTTTPDSTPAGTATSTIMPLPGAFNLLTPESGVIVRNPANITTVTWSAATNAQSYRFVLFKLSNNTRQLGTALDLMNQTPAADADLVSCTDVLCTLAVPAAVATSLTDGQYAWTVFASNMGMETEASNAPFFFTINTGDLELVANGGFEMVDLQNAPVLTPWVGRRLNSNDKIVCNKVNRPGGRPDKILAQEGSCAFRFKGNPGQNAQIRQNLPFAGVISAGDTLTLSLQANTKIANAGKIAVVKVRYAEDTAGLEDNGKDKIEVRLDAPTTGETYQLFTGSLVVDGTINQLRIQLQNKSAAGNLFIDAVSVIAAPAVPATPAATATTDGSAPTGTPEPTGTSSFEFIPLP